MQALKVVFVLGLTLSVTFAVIPGRITPLKGVQLVEAKELLTRTLEKLATGDGPNYQVVKVIKATTQVVAGTLKKFEVKLFNGSVTRECEVGIWTHPWQSENGTEITIQCSGDKLVQITW